MLVLSISYSNEGIKLAKHVCGYIILAFPEFDTEKHSIGRCYYYVVILFSSENRIIQVQIRHKALRRKGFRIRESQKGCKLLFSSVSNFVVLTLLIRKCLVELSSFQV